jgi:hypothetical protein
VISFEQIFGVVFAAFSTLVAATVIVGFAGPRNWIRWMVLAALSVGLIQAVLITCHVVLQSIATQDFEVIRFAMLMIVWSYGMFGRYRFLQRRQTAA